jgi:acylphosphatase
MKHNSAGIRGMINRYKTQSISVTDEELEMFKRLAAVFRMKPAAVARALLYRGIDNLLKDGRVHALETDEELFERLTQWLKTVSVGETMRVPVISTANENAHASRKTKRIRGPS